MGKFGVEEGSRIAEIARRIRASQQQAEVQNYKDEPLEDFIVRVNPALSKPTHFGKKVLSLLNRVKYRDRIRLLWSVPPGHAKSWTVMYLIAQCLSLDPKLRVAYITHTEAFAFRHSRQIRDICEAAGVQLSKTVNAASLWETTSGGSLTAMGVGGAIMGMRFDLIVVDDPYASRPDAESALERARTAAFFNPGIVSRVGHPKRSSIIVIHTRYHPEDLIGDISAREVAQANVALREGWDYINLPAINDGTDPDPDRPIGAPLWPQQWPLDELLKKQAENDYEWASLYMGQPRPRGGAVFNDVHYYEQLPQGEPRRTAIGIDLAYTVKTYSDYSVVISAALYGDTMYILNFRRKQMEVKRFAAEIRSEQIMRPGATTYWAVGPIERPIAQLLQTLDLRIHAEVGRGGKFERAQFVATAWNNGKVLLPKGAPWLDEFTKEVLSFTGLGDKHDDVVDALANAHYPLLGRKFAPRGVAQTRLPIY